MKSHQSRMTAFTLVEILVATALIAVVSGVAVVGVRGVREQARETRLRNDVMVLNNGIDAYLAAGGFIPAGASAEEVVAKLKTVADPQTSTSLGPPGPFIDPRMQVVRQSAGEGAASSPRADYPDSSGYFYVRQGGAPGIKEFAQGAASPTVIEARQGTIPMTPTADSSPTMPIDRLPRRRLRQARKLWPVRTKQRKPAKIWSNFPGPS